MSNGVLKYVSAAAVSIGSVASLCAFSGVIAVGGASRQPVAQVGDRSQIDVVIIDGRLKLHAPTWRNAGWKLVQIGRATTL